MRNALKALGAVLAVIALCAPLMFLPTEDTQPAALGRAGATVTVPATVVVATTIPGLETTTTTTTEPSEPPPSTTPSSTTTTTTGPTDVVIAAVGDVLATPEVLESVHNASLNSYDFGPIFGPIAPYLQGADYTVAALESRLAGPEVGYSSESVPNAPRELAFALKSAGVDLVGTANQHSLGLGWEGIVGTLDRLDAAGLRHIGTARTSAERNTPVIADIKGIRVAFLDYAASVDGSLPADEQKDFAVNLLDEDTVTQDAYTARVWGADIVVAMLDYGEEDAQQPSAEQVALFDQILDHGGVDVILGCHPRVFQTIGHRITYVTWRVNDKYVAYSMGDFLAHRPQEPVGGDDAARSGMVVYLHIQKRGLRTYVTGVSYLPLYLQVGTTTTGTATGATTTTTPGAEDVPVAYRILPVLPGLEPATDIALTADDRAQMAEIWEYARKWLYRPDEKITPLSPGGVGL